MYFNKTTRILAALMSAIMLFLVGCSGGKTPDDPNKEPEDKLPWAVTDYNEAEIIDKNVRATQIREVIMRFSICI